MLPKRIIIAYGECHQFVSHLKYLNLYRDTRFRLNASVNLTDRYPFLDLVISAYMFAIGTAM